MEFSHGKCVLVGSFPPGERKFEKIKTHLTGALTDEVIDRRSFVCSYSDPLGPGSRHLDPLQHHGRRR